ncbi:DNA-binding response regulator [Massilia sp. KIM]|uniref:response regulator n=1 Tax=Massilia sp. KIM TaxID=1955422 RepID=UPI00098EED67|nr:response regulator transcription factor [Massilia sp. KIM]OON60870.1 DNA-binding response regulator [Massilia sp. KIM]
MKILLVEDEAEFAAAVRGALEREKYVVDCADRLALAREALRGNSYDLALLDRSLPDGDGLSLVPAMRAALPGVHIIVLSARGDVADRVAGLDEGADDYLSKPFALEELFARIRAVRRRPAQLGLDHIQVGSLVFDLDNDEASVNGVPLTLSRRELRVLATLIRRRGRTVLRETLEQGVYGFDDAIQSNTLDSHISRLRRKLAAVEAGVEIHAIKGVGYLLRAQP